MITKSAEQLLAEATTWWSTSIIDIKPGTINVRGYPIEELIGKLTFPEMIWLMLRAELPTPGHARLLEAALVAGVDHGPQAPSIAISRMAVTCGLSVNGAMASAINVLDDVHGGAGQQCMDLMQKIAARDASDAELNRAVASELEVFVKENGKVIPGFGHRFHPIDPRAVRLLALVASAKAEGLVSGRYADIGVAIEGALSGQKGQHIPMNIDGVTAVIYCELGFPAALGRGLFILSRSVGILAHAWEQGQQGGRIKGPMPSSIPFEYTGPPLRHVGAEVEEDDVAGARVLGLKVV
jgi:citrate synthase